MLEFLKVGEGVYFYGLEIDIGIEISYDDVLIGGLGNDIIDGGLGDDMLIGGVGDDVILIGVGWDIVEIGGGNDIVFVGEGENIINIGIGGVDLYIDINGDMIVNGFDVEVGYIFSFGEFYVMCEELEDVVFV